MNSFPRYGFPFPYLNPYRKYNYYNTFKKNNKTSSSNFNVTTNKEKNIQNNNTDVWLDIFGIKLYSDDILILSLLYFLYEEEVKDEGLFLALVLLLIS